MVTKKTVFVLGAGASMPFGFPSGSELVEKILEQLSDGEARVAVEQALDEGDVGYPGSLDTFLAALRKSGCMSIDAFLQHNQTFLHTGKLAIAAVLCPMERDETLFQTGANWYKQLLSHLNTTFEEFPKNKVSFITFNYDRSLERFLITSLENSHGGKTYEQCVECVKQLPVVHIHGQLGKLPASKLIYDEGARDYNGRISSRDLRRCARDIRIIHEEVGHSDELEQAKQLIRDAEKVCFLGLGYAKTNLDRLSLRGLSFDNNKLQLYGTAHGLGAAQRDWVSSYFFDAITLYQGKIDGCLADLPVLLERMEPDDDIGSLFV